MSMESKFVVENCPLCDESPKFHPMIVYPNGEISPSIVTCRVCGISLESFESDVDAVGKWNRRRQLEQARKTIENYRTALEDIGKVTALIL